jgi:hypothetical protein
MIKSLFKNPSPLPSLFRGEGEQRLTEAKKNLASVEKKYASGKFSGHPEDMLEAIDGYEAQVRTLTKARKRGWVPDEMVISEMKADQQAFTNSSYSPDIIDEISWKERKLEDSPKYPSIMKTCYGNSMFRNPFKSYFLKQPAGSAPRSTQREGERRLKEAKKTLASLQADSTHEDFPADPEDLFDTIKDFEQVVHILTKAQKRGWVPDKMVINVIKDDLEKQKEFMVSQDYPQKIIDDEIAWRQRHLEEARQGLR